MTLKTPLESLSLRDKTWMNEVSRKLNAAPEVLDKAATPTTVSNTTTETTIVSHTIPAGTLGLSNIIRIEIGGSCVNNSGGTPNLTLKFKYGSTVVYGDAANSIPSNSRTRGIRIFFDLVNNGSSESSQVGTGLIVLGSVSSADTGYGNINGTGVQGHDVVGGTASEDSTTDLDLEVTAQWSTAASTITLTKQWHTITKY